MQLSTVEYNSVLNYRERRCDTLIAMTRRYLREVYNNDSLTLHIVRGVGAADKEVYANISVDTKCGTVVLRSTYGVNDEVVVEFIKVHMNDSFQSTVAAMMLETQK